MPDDSNNSKTRVGAMAPDASTSPVEWGPEIRVGGKRPSWLEWDTPFQWTDRLHPGFDWWQDENTVAHCFNPKAWGDLLTIRLPADHPHYRQPTTPELDPALWDRMVALVRGFADSPGQDRWLIDARAIVADLPKPVDPDLIEARKLAACDGFYEGTRETVERGEHDDAWPVRIALAAIKRGRRLAGEQA